MNSNKRYQIVAPSLSIDRDFYPINDKDISYTWENEDDKIFYDKKLKNRLVFGNDTKNGITDFTYLYNLESNAASRCADFFLNIYTKCDGVFVLEYEGKFSLNDCEWDLDRCTVSFKPENNSSYECLKKQKNKEANILALPNIITTKANLDYNYEFFVCNKLVGACSLPGTNPSTWDLFYQNLSQSYNSVCTSSTYLLRVYYREFVVVACVGGVPSTPPGTGWFLETNNCGTSGTAKYVRAATAGPLPSIGTSSIAIGWYNTVTSTDELPPNPAFQQVVVSNTPNSENLFEYYPVIFESGVAGVTIDWPMSVINNSNSSYVWSLDGTSPLTGVVSGATNACLVRANGATNGNLIFKNTETHGNAHVSTKSYTVSSQVINSGTQTLSGSTLIRGNSYACKNQTQLYFAIPDVPTVNLSGGYTATISNIVWSVTGGATITSGQGTPDIYVTAGSSNFIVSVTWSIAIYSPTSIFQFQINFAPSKSITVQNLPVTEPIVGILNRYPNEPNSFLLVPQHTGAVTNWYRDSVSAGLGVTFGSYSIYSFTAPASAGTYCYYAKETINCGCNWIKLEDSEAIAGSVPWPKFPPVYWCYSDSATAISYTRGRLFKEACQYVLQEMGCGFSTIYSDFFEWNPLGLATGYTAGINYVTGSTNKLRYLTIHQKSDVLNPTSSNAATKGMLSFEKMTKIWREVFNCYWWIDSLGRFRLEHLSFFNNSVAYDSTVAPHASFNTSKRKYTYNKEKMPKFERFQFSEVLFADFIGADIYYDSACVNQDPESNVSERGVKDIMTTDLYALFIDPASANKTGFVLMCNNYDGSLYTVDAENGAISNSLIANAHLSWANLHVNFHKYGRILLNGSMNNTNTVFYTAKKNKQQKDIVLNLCCTDSFDPTMSLIKTALGNGKVESAERNISTGILKAILLHD